MSLIFEKSLKCKCQTHLIGSEVLVHCKGFTRVNVSYLVSCINRISQLCISICCHLLNFLV